MEWLKLESDRKIKGVSYERLAQIVGITQSGIYNAIKRKTLTVKDFEKVCEALNSTPCDYFECTGPVKSTSEPGTDYKTEIEFLRKQGACYKRGQ